MNKLIQPEANDFDESSDPFGPPLSDVDMEAWIERNRDEINASLVRARQDFAEGKAEPWDPEDIMAEVREQLRNEGR